jgi:predicted SprT family Zn-dependent metalloprotease
LEGKDPQREVKTPYKKPRGGELTEEQKLFNRVFNRGRVIVEHALAHLKVFQVLKQVYRHRRAQHNTIFRIIAGLVNRRLDRRLAAAAAAA